MTRPLSKKRIGLFGGSFDPPHLGHEALVSLALELLGLDEVWVIPAGMPVHRNLSGHADGGQRLAWAEAMFADHPNVRVLDWEVNRNKPVAAIHTLKQFRELGSATVPLWLCGADSFAGMERWVGYPEHQRLCSVAVFSRAGEAAVELPEGWQELSVAAWRSDPRAGAGHLIRVDAKLPDISATQVRSMAERGESLQGLVNSRICREVASRYGMDSGV